VRLILSILHCTPYYLRYVQRQHVPLLQLEGLRGKGFHSRHFPLSACMRKTVEGSRGGALASHRPIAIGPPALRTTWMPCQTRHVAHFLRTGAPVKLSTALIRRIIPSGRPPGPPSNRPLHLLPVYAHTFSFHTCNLPSRAFPVLVKDSSSQHCQPLQQPASVSGVTHCSPTSFASQRRIPRRVANHRFREPATKEALPRLISSPTRALPQY
jgi:hypothetical protein